ncbi:MAG: YitT family protein [Calditrichaceae bacterium]
MRRIFKNRTFRDYLFITVGSILMAIGIGVFLVDARVVPGGVSGFAMALHYLSGNQLPVGLMIWIFNIPLYIWGLKALGSRFGVRTFYGFSVNSFFIDFFRGDIPGLSQFALNTTDTIKDLMQNDFLFLILIGSALLGVGLGLVFKFKGTTGGSDIVAAIFQKRYGAKPGQVILMIDFLVIILAGLIIYFKDLSPDRPAMSLTFYSFFLVFVSARIIDIILDGFDYARSAYIISEKHDLIAEQIMAKLSRGATALKGRGLYKNVDREILVTVITRREIGILEEIIEDIDPDAFVIINTVHEVRGEGFRRRI